MKGLQQLTGDMGLAIIIVHHVRKGIGNVDPFEMVSGTMGLTGAADTVIVLDRDSSGCTLYCRGRDIEEYEKAVTFDKFSCKWVAQGNASDVRRTDERSTILDVLKDADEPMGPTDIADASGMQRKNVKMMMHRMAKAGDVVKAKRGKYVHPERSDPYTPVTSVTNDDWDDDD